MAIEQHLFQPFKYVNATIAYFGNHCAQVRQPLFHNLSFN